MSINTEYQKMITTLFDEGWLVHTRNATTLSIIHYPELIFTEFPLVTIRKTAWKKAISEMEWFLSGEELCPENFKDTWWKGQLDADGKYRKGYGYQLRHFTTGINQEGFDQVAFILENLKDHPESRRLITTTWNPFEMANITTLNDNKQTPTSCHGTLTQFFIRDECLHIKQYQRSADVLLGVPHNWVQYWAWLLYLTYHCQLEIGSLSWIFGDLHLYHEDSHIAVANELLENEVKESPVELCYSYSGGITKGIPTFKASDFTIKGQIAEPSTTLTPKLLA